ncbi:MAG: c-type cytochrome [Flammeovirgaceae bacterium]|nr:c-type cytochrome [Flammeovirgaceae bacterium]
MSKTEETKAILNLTNTALISIFFILVLGGVIIFALALNYENLTKISSHKAAEFPVEMESNKILEQRDYFSRDFDVSKLGNTIQDSMIKYGHELITNTSKLIGPSNGNSSKQFAGNNLECKNCHLEAGTKPFSAPYVGIYGRFPQYRGRENKVGSLEERVNGCMERSMNGKKLPENGKEMRAIVAYMNWLSKEIPTGEKIEGTGFKPIKIPQRKVSLENGKSLYAQKCSSCHNQDGTGTKNPDGNYAFPPIAGKDSYNQGAGMHRVLTSAQFIKYNMPLGATVQNPILTDEEAYDIAGFINTLERPGKKNTKKDFPDLKRKPISTPYGPWVDNFPPEQHKFGPYQEIIEWYKTEFNLEKNK